MDTGVIVAVVLCIIGAVVYIIYKYFGNSYIKTDNPDKIDKELNKILNTKKNTAYTTDDAADNTANDIINHINQGHALIANRALMKYEEYLSLYMNRNCVNTIAHSKPVIAALLFSAFDLTFSEHPARKEATSKVFSYLEDSFTQNELQIFDSSFIVFADLICGKYSARGDWCLLKDPVEGWYMNCFVACGDMLQYPQYITNYENEPFPFSVSSEPNLSFIEEFISLETLFLNYIQSLRGLLSLRI